MSSRVSLAMSVLLHFVLVVGVASQTELSVKSGSSRPVVVDFVETVEKAQPKASVAKKKRRRVLVKKKPAKPKKMVSSIKPSSLAKPEKQPAAIEEKQVSPVVSAVSLTDQRESEEMSGKGSGLSSAESVFQARVQSFLARQKKYPRMARRLNQQGRIVVRFILKKDGRLESFQLIEKSPHPILDRAAKSLIEKIDGKLPFPGSIAREKWVFVLPVEYTL